MEIILEDASIWSMLFEEGRDSVLIFIPTLAVVYIFGRMLGFLKSYRTKNTLALIINFITAYMYVNLVYEFDGDWQWMAWNVFYKGCIGILWYVLIGFHLFDRIDNLLDHKLYKDEKD